MSVSVPQIAAYLERVLANDPTERAVALQAPSRQPWPEAVTQRGRRFELRWCESALAIREALCEIEQADQAAAGLVVLTPLATHQIAEDIASRLARGQVYQPQAWETVLQFFNARQIDARLGRYKWMPQLLIDGAAQGPMAPVPSGFLDLETAWREVLKRFLLLDSARPDGVTLLQWSMQPEVDASLNLLTSVARSDVMRWLREAAGAAGSLVLSCVEAGRTGDALPLGLVCGVVYAPEAEGQIALGQAAARMERFIDGRHLVHAEGSAWATAALQVVSLTEGDLRHVVLQRAEVLLKELRIAEFAHLSDWLQSGLDQRMATFAQALTAHAATPTTRSLDEVERSAVRCLQHALLEAHSQRRDSIEMARRLARWLVGAPSAGETATAVLSWQADEGAFADWARFRLLGGDELTELSSAYGDVRAAVIQRRNALAQRFAGLLQRANAQALPPEPRVIPLEKVLDRVVGPLAALHPVLMLVMDGLSVSIFRELFARIGTLGWTELVPADVARPLVGMAALPTITEVSRASLLCGRLTLGSAPQEKTGFARHPALLQACGAQAPPRLLHKADLSDATNLAQEARALIADTSNRVVGVVYNAVDDHLSGPDQLHQRWALEDLRLLLPLLREAREARRVVIVTADHGHLLEDGTEQLPGAESDRWRPGTTASSPQEVALRGGRVLTLDETHAVVCLWGERTRYTGRKNGYHGGVSPQEMTVPLSVLAPVNMNVQGWQPAAPVQPDWWDLPVRPDAQALTDKPAPAARPTQRPPRQRAPAPTEQALLFDAPPPAPAAPSAASVPATPETAEWVSALLASPIYASQRQLAARVAVPDDKMRVLLLALHERGGKLSRAALAQRMGLPEVSMRGMLSVVRRMLNVDQSPVLMVDETAGMVELNHALLLRQFCPPGTPGQDVSGGTR